MVHYYRRLKWLILGLALLTGLVTIPVSAGNPEVNITFSAWSIMNPQGFTVTYVNDHQTDLSWTIPAGTTNVMIRSSAGRVPTDRTNGSLIYYGSDTSCSDTGIRLDGTTGAVYYSAWGENAGGEWSPLYSEGQMPCPCAWPAERGRGRDWRRHRRTSP